MDTSRGTPEARFGIRCPGCARTQPTGWAGPVGSGREFCAFCRAPLHLTQWVAHPPPGLGIEGRAHPGMTNSSGHGSGRWSGSAPGAQRPGEWPRQHLWQHGARSGGSWRQGPPSYGPAHPAWGFPPVALVAPRDTRPAPSADPVRYRARGLLVTAALAVLTALAALAAAGAEAWRFALLLDGRTRVLDGATVSASDTAVAAAGAVVLVLGVITACSALVVLPALYAAAAARAGRAPVRRGAALLARLVVPGWNLYGAGQVLHEIARLLPRTVRGRRPARALLAVWWVAWVVDGLLVLATAVAAWGRSPQVMANTVELHIAVDVAAAVVAGLFAAILVVFRRSWAGGRAWIGDRVGIRGRLRGRRARWQVVAAETA